MWKNVAISTAFLEKLAFITALHFQKVKKCVNKWMAFTDRGDVDDVYSDKNIKKQVAAKGQWCKLRFLVVNE